MHVLDEVMDGVKGNEERRGYSIHSFHKHILDN